jgi:hypothetical protein
MLFLLLASALFICGVGLIIYGDKYATKSVEDTIIGFGAAMLTFGSVIAFIISIAFMTSCDSALELEASYKVFQTQSYHEAIQIIQENGQLILALSNNQRLTDFAEAKQIEVYANAVTKLRQDVLEYNLLLAKKEAYNNSLMFDWIIVMPKNVKPVSIKQEGEYNGSR